MGLFTGKNHDEPYRRLTDGALLDRIRAGDSLAETYLWLTYHPVVSAHMTAQLRHKPQQAGDAGDYVHDAILLLLDKARSVGAAVLKHTYSTIGGWLKQTAAYFLVAATRSDQPNDRDLFGHPEETGDEPRSVVDTLADKGADGFVDMPGKDRDQIIGEVLATLPEKLSTMIRLKFMAGCSWQETADRMMTLYPDNDPPFGLAYLQKTYWDRIHKKPFFKKLGDALT